MAEPRRKISKSEFINSLGPNGIKIQKINENELEIRDFHNFQYPFLDLDLDFGLRFVDCNFAVRGIENCHFSQGLSFVDCSIKGDLLSIDSSDIDGGLEFEGLKANSGYGINLWVKRSKIKKLKLLNSTINEINIVTDADLESLSFSHSDLGSLKISDSCINSYFRIDFCSFRDMIEIKASEILWKIADSPKMKHPPEDKPAESIDYFGFSNSQISNLNINELKSKNSVFGFYNNILESEFRISSSNYIEIIDMRGNIFHSKFEIQNFLFCSFLNISQNRFEGYINAFKLKSKTMEVFKFQDNLCFGKVELSYVSFKKATVYFSGTTFLDYIFVFSTEVIELIFKNNLFERQFRIEDAKVEKKNSEYFLIKKNNSLIKNDHHNALINKQEELNYRYLEADNCPDIILLWVNKWSNKFGLSYVRGMLVTLIVSIFFFLIFNLSLLIVGSIVWCDDPITFKNIGNSFAQYFHFLNPNLFDQTDVWGVEISQLRIWPLVWLGVGKLFIGFCLYQTIVAFRKNAK